MARVRQDYIREIEIIRRRLPGAIPGEDADTCLFRVHELADPHSEAVVDLAPGAVKDLLRIASHQYVETLLLKIVCRVANYKPLHTSHHLIELAGEALLSLLEDA